MRMTFETILNIIAKNYRLTTVPP